MYTRSSTTGRPQRGEEPPRGGDGDRRSSFNEEGEDDPSEGGHPDDSDDPQGSEGAATDSEAEASSVGSGGFNTFGLDLSDFVDLSDNSFCRAIMSRKDPATKRIIPCGCGSVAADCNRRGHGLKRSEDKTTQVATKQKAASFYLHDDVTPPSITK